LVSVLFFQTGDFRGAFAEGKAVFFAAFPLISHPFGMT